MKIFGFTKIEFIKDEEPLRDKIERKIVSIKEELKSNTKVERIKGVQFMDSPIYKTKEKINEAISKIKK